MRKITITGFVTEGSRIAGKLGYPTANLIIDKQPCLDHGVYLGRAALSEKVKDAPSIIFYGTPYSLGNSLPPRFEVHILNQKKLMLYNTELTVRCEYFMRKNKKFSSLEKLKRAIQKDVERARQYFSIKT